MLLDLPLYILLVEFSFFTVMWILSSSKVFGFSLPSLPTVCFAPVIDTMPVDRSMSCISSHVSSMGLCPRSFEMDNLSFISILALLCCSSSLGALTVWLFFLWLILHRRFVSSTALR